MKIHLTLALCVVLCPVASLAKPCSKLPSLKPKKFCDLKRGAPVDPARLAELKPVAARALPDKELIRLTSSQATVDGLSRHISKRRVLCGRRFRVGGRDIDILHVSWSVTAKFPKGKAPGPKTRSYYDLRGFVSRLVVFAGGSKRIAGGITLDTDAAGTSSGRPGWHQQIRIDVVGKGATHQLWVVETTTDQLGKSWRDYTLWRLDRRGRLKYQRSCQK